AVLRDRAVELPAAKDPLIRGRTPVLESQLLHALDPSLAVAGSVHSARLRGSQVVADGRLEEVVQDLLLGGVGVGGMEAEQSRTPRHHYGQVREGPSVKIDRGVPLPDDRRVRLLVRPGRE